MGPKSRPRGPPKASKNGAAKPKRLSAKALRSKASSVYTEGSDEDGDEDGGDDDDSHIMRIDNKRGEYEDDEEIDEDEAFNEEDEERYGSVRVPKKKGDRKAVTFQSEDDDVEDMDDEDTVDLSDMLGSGTASALAPVKTAAGKQQAPKKGQKRALDVLKTSLHGDDEDDDDTLANELEDEEDQADEDDDVDAHGKLLSVVKGLGGSAARAPSVKRRKVQEKTESWQEGEFNVAPSGRRSETSSTLAELMSSLEGTTGFAHLKSQMTNLGRKSKVLSAPLSAPLQDRIDRKAAYSQSKAELDKWLPLVQHNRRADHLSFPLNAPKQQAISSNAINARFEPTTELEVSVQEMLEDSGLKVGATEGQAFEQLQAAEVSEDEIQKRRAELLKQRHLMFHYELKAKRAAKIKSKEYHKLLRKEKEKEKKKLGLADMMELGGDAADAARMDAEQKRAEERMSLRHKSGGQFARELVKRGKDTPETRKARLEQLAIGEQLRRKVDSYQDGAQMSGDEDEADPENDEEPEEAKKTGDDSEEMLDSGLELPEKGLFALKFMQRGLEKRKAAAKQMLHDLEEQLLADREPAADDDDGNDDDDENDKAFSKNSAKKSSAGVSGRRVVGLDKVKASDRNQKDDSKNAEAEVEEEDEEDDDEPAFLLPVINTKPQQAPEKKSESKPKADKRSAATTTATSAATTTATSAATTTATSAATTTATSAATTTAKKSKQPAKQVVEDDDDEDDHVFSIGNTFAAQLQTIDGGATATTLPSFDLSQRDLVAQAFAADNVLVEDFEREKAALVDEERPKDQDVTLPGWGMWGGSGVRPSKKRFIVPAPKDVKPRADDKLKHVIINEKQNAKASKFVVTSVPHQFKTKEQYERSIRNPLGKEWNGVASFQKNIKPRIITKAGAIIEPLQFSKKYVSSLVEKHKDLPVVTAAEPAKMPNNRAPLAGKRGKF